MAEDLDPAEAKRRLTEMLEGLNGGGPLEAQIKELRDKVDRLAFNAEVEKAVQERLEAERQKQAEAQAAVENLPRRSEMTALEKSRFLRAHGKQVYDALPW